jgi:lipopolysaccharide export system permease protein
VIVILVLFIWPWANQQTEDLKKQFEMRSDLSRVEPGKFQESSNGTRVFFIDKSTETQGYGRNVFVVAREGDKEVITSASGGHIENRDGQSFLVLEGGQRLESDTKTGEHRLVFFEKYGTLQGDKPLGRIDNRRPSTIPTGELLTHTQPVLQGELAWRLGLPMAALNFVLIGLLAADMNPRSGRSWSLTLALLSFLVYYNLINITQAYIGAGRIGMIPMFIGLHGTVLALALLWLSKKHWGWSWLGGSSK